MEHDSIPMISSRKLIHHPLCPHSRFIRLVLYEKSLDFSMIKEEFWLERENFLYLNPAGQVPILIDDDRSIICNVMPIFEYLEENYLSEILLMPDKPIERAEVRRLLEWFHQKFYSEISYALLNERVWKRSIENSYPDSTVIRRAIALLPEHLLYIAHLLKGKDWISGHKMGAADLAAAAHISVIDFLNNMPWNAHNNLSAFDQVREWYARIKSRPSFRALTKDVIDGFTPPLHYADPDF